MARFHVAVSDSVFPNLDPARAVLSRIGAELHLANHSTSTSILEVAKSADALLVTYATITEPIIRQMKRCRIISRFGIGVDNIDVLAATKAGMVVTKVPDYCVSEVSDHTLALLLALVRKIPFANGLVQNGRWEMPAVVPIHRIRGKTLGLLGFGQIPRLVAEKAKAFGMTIITHDPYIPPEVTREAKVESVSFATLLETADYLSIHAALTDETKGMFGVETLRRMKRTAFLINTARGLIVDEDALAEALDQGQLAGAALDVMREEPPKASPLFGRSNVILTPHTSFYSVESLLELQTKAAEEVVRVLEGQAPLNPVAIPPVLA
jgi:D-3-phosphoglycerate dehydrogenase / 2-oxoglutarate reductase